MLAIFAIIAVFVLYAVVYKPDIAAILLFVLVLSNINVDIPGFFLNTRAILTLLLLVRIFFDSHSGEKDLSFSGSSHVKIFIFFLFYVALISLYNDNLSFSVVKELMLSLIIAYFAYYFYFKRNSTYVLRISLLIAGVICFADLAYTYAVWGGFPIRRIYFLMNDYLNALTDEELVYMTNHNFFGMICGMSFMFFITKYFTERKMHRVYLFSLPLTFLGVLMSTSRSALISLIVFTLIVIFIGYRNQMNRNRIMKFSVNGLLLFFVSLLFIGQIQELFDLKSEFIDELMLRMVDEPITILKRSLGYSYDIHKLGSMDWREESSANAYQAYLNLDMSEQIFGIGFGGFEIRNLGFDYNAHNAILLMLIEYGMLGLGIYLLLILSVVNSVIQLRAFTPTALVVLFFLLFCLGQNREITSSIFYIFLITLIAETDRASLKKRLRSNIQTNSRRFPKPKLSVYQNISK